MVFLFEVDSLLLGSFFNVLLIIFWKVLKLWCFFWLIVFIRVVVILISFRFFCYIFGFISFFCLLWLRLSLLFLYYCRMGFFRFLSLVYICLLQVFYVYFIGFCSCLLKCRVVICLGVNCVLRCCGCFIVILQQLKLVLLNICVASLFFDLWVIGWKVWQVFRIFWMCLGVSLQFFVFRFLCSLVQC